MKKLLILLVVVGFVACNSGTKKAEEKTSGSTELVQASLSIGGMYCSNCVASVTKGINSLDGIADVAVTLDDSTAIVKYDASEVNMDDIKAAVAKRGYTVKSVN